MSFEYISRNRPLLRHRDNLGSNLQALTDGLLVILLCYVTPIAITGVFTVYSLFMTLALLVTMGVVYDRYGVYHFNRGLVEKAIVLMKAWATSYGFVFLLAFLTGYASSVPRSVVITIFGVGYVTQLLVHFLFRLFYRGVLKYNATNRSLIIGTGKLSDYIFDRIEKNPWINESVIGVVRTLDQEPDTDSEVPLLGTIQDVDRIVRDRGVNTVYLVIPLENSPIVERLYFDLLDRNVNIHWVPNIFALHLINHSVKELAGIPILTLSESPLIGTAALLKNIEDKVLASLALLLVGPVMLITAILVKLESAGPVFFRQERTGWDGKTFRIWKFRSMRVHEPAEGVIKQATRDDPRVTRVGRFIRRTSIDELPQLFNVLSGEMSLVGPRPHAIEHNEEYSRQITAYLARHRTKPGLTGLAQVRGYRGETSDLSLMIKRIESDIEYINNWTITLDLSIMIRTAFTLFRRNVY